MLGAARFMSGSAFDADAIALFAAMANQPSQPRQVIMNQLIVDLKSAGVWAKCDILAVPGLMEAGNTSTQALINWKLNTFTLLPTNVAFTANRGVRAGSTAGDGVQVQSPGPVNTPQNTLVQYQLNSAHAAIWVNLSGGTTGASIGLNPTNLNLLSLTPSNGTNFTGALNSVGAPTIFGTASTPLGSRILSRTASNLTTGYNAGASSGTTANASGSLAGSAVVLLRTGTVPSEHRCAQISLGAGLTSTEAGDYYIALNTALTAVGAQ